ncbi:MAG: hypothetical protein AAF138_10940 [Planctomycetota bacterium]
MHDRANTRVRNRCFGAMATGLITALGGPVVSGGLLSGALVTGIATTATAQLNDADPVANAMKRQTLARLMQPLTVDLTETRLGDIVTFIESATNTDLDPLWLDERTGVGLDPEALITVKVKDQTALSLIEAVLEQADRGSGFGESTWQFTKSGAFEFGPKERLNRRAELVVYDIMDLLTEVPNYDNAPDFDLNTIFQQGGQGGGGGGGGQSPFGQGGQAVDRAEREDLAAEIVDLVVTLVEPEQWMDNGGEAASVRYFRGSLLVRAPDYMHRQLIGYSWWPARFQAVRSIEGRRYVTLSAPTAIGTVDFERTVRTFAAP